MVSGYSYWQHGHSVCIVVDFTDTNADASVESKFVWPFSHCLLKNNQGKKPLGVFTGPRPNSNNFNIQNYGLLKAKNPCPRNC